jgi:hypothetical protein
VHVVIRKLPPEKEEIFELAAALVAAYFAVGLGPRWGRLLQEHLLAGLVSDQLSRIGYNKHYKKALSLEALITYTIIWACTPGPNAGPDERAIELINFRMMRPAWLTATALGNAARRALRLKVFLKPQFTPEKFISSKRRHVRAGVEFGLITCKDVENSNSVAVYSTEKLHALMVEFWKGQAAIMYRLICKLDKKAGSSNQGDKEETGAE